MGVENKVVVISGGGTGIGRAAALLFAEKGANVTVVGRRLEPLQETVRLVQQQGGSASYCSGDVSNSRDVRDIVSDVMSANDRIDVLINNAAVLIGTDRTILDLDEEDWDKVMAVNVKGVFLLSKYVIPHMIAAGGGVIVNCSSISGHIGQPLNGAYNASKGGVELLTKCMALDFAEHGIRVNAVAPGWVKNPEIERSDEEGVGLHPMGRLGTPDDVAKAYLYLSSDESSWVTGTTLMIDGGYTAQ